MKASLAIAAGLLLACAVPVRAEPIKIVAAENFYGDVAKQIGGDNVAVTSLLTNPDQDPHLFEASASTARDVVGARIVIANGADYDPWMEKLIAANKSQRRIEIIIADLVGKKAGDNPHLWYDPATMPAYAQALASALAAIDPAHKDDYAKGARAFIDSLQPLSTKISELKSAYGGLPITASEPVFGYMAGALGLKMHNESFQLAVMNNTEPSASDVVKFENDLKGHKVKVMLFNSQASDPAVQRLIKIAEEAKVPVVGVGETEPQGKTYQRWMFDQLDEFGRALAGGSS
jgi:zinc/manganese transport system substrate-binding protein